MRAAHCSSGVRPAPLAAPCHHVAEHIHLRRDAGGDQLDVAVRPQAGGRRDELADDDVLFEAAELVDLALEGSVGEHLGGLLEGSGRQEALGGQRGLGDAEDDLLAGGGLAAVVDDLLVLLVEDQAIDHASRQEAGVSRGLDQDLLGHLPHDQLHVLVVDLHALLVVDILDLAHDVAGGLDGSPVLEQLVRVERALVELVARLHTLAVLDHEVGPAADGVAVYFLAGIVEDDDLLGLVGLFDVDRRRRTG